MRRSTIRRPVLLNSLPKAGTGLLRPLVLAMPGASWAGHVEATRELAGSEERIERLDERITDLSPGAVWAAHLPHCRPVAAWLARRGIRQIFLYRDPRDVTVSWHHHVAARPGILPYGMFARLETEGERLMAAIRGIGDGRRRHVVSRDSFPGIGVTFDAYLGWLDDPATLAVRYEELISTRPGRAAAGARATVAAILEHLGAAAVAGDAALAGRILARGLDPERSYTFRRGVAGGWKEEYSPEHVEAFRAAAGDLVERLGYSWER